MRQFIKRALDKAGKLSSAQFHDLLLSSSKEIDRLEAVLDSLPGGILVCDNAHKLILANKAARRFLSIASYEQGREAVWSVIPDEIVAEFLANTLVAAVKAEEREFDVGAGTVRRLLSVSVMPLVREGHVTGSLIIADDITERRQKEAHVRRMENLASLTTVAAGVAHEIKNPLAALSIHVQLIQKTIEANKNLFSPPSIDGAPSTDGAFLPEGAAGNAGAGNNVCARIGRYLLVINEEIERLNGIVVDFLFAVRPMNPELRRGNINALVSSVAEFLAFELEEAKIKTSLSLAENLPAVNFDERLMKQALINLLKNAEAAMPDGGKLFIATAAKEGEVKITIADTGAGIAEENIAKIFEPYFTTRASGSGLGLTLVFKIVKEHRGEIGVESREGEGSVFTLTLPLPQTERLLLAQRGEM